jgi:NitT/TauT family transport system substrate-binding protein
MERLMTASLMALAAGTASAEDVTLQLKWVTQALSLAT